MENPGHEEKGKGNVRYEINQRSFEVSSCWTNQYTQVLLSVSWASLGQLNLLVDQFVDNAGFINNTDCSGNISLWLKPDELTIPRIKSMEKNWNKPTSKFCKRKSYLRLSTIIMVPRVCTHRPIGESQD